MSENKEMEELQARIKSFNNELISLLGKYKVGLGAIPVITTDGRILARPHIFDDSKPVVTDEKPKSDIVTE